MSYFGHVVRITITELAKVALYGHLMGNKKQGRPQKKMDRHDQSSGAIMGEKGCEQEVANFRQTRYEGTKFQLRA